MPIFPTDTLFSGSYQVTPPFQVLLGSVPITPGLYQVRITVPSAIPPGDQTIWLDFGSAQSIHAAFLTIQP